MLKYTYDEKRGLMEIFDKYDLDRQHLANSASKKEWDIIRNWLSGGGLYTEEEVKICYQNMLNNKKWYYDLAKQNTSFPKFLAAVFIGSITFVGNYWLLENIGLMIPIYLHYFLVFGINILLDYTSFKLIDLPGKKNIDYLEEMLKESLGLSKDNKSLNLGLDNPNEEEILEFVKMIGEDINIIFNNKYVGYREDVKRLYNLSREYVEYQVKEQGNRKVRLKMSKDSDYTKRLIEIEYNVKEKIRLYNLEKNNNSYIDNIVNSCDVSKGIPSYQGLSEEQGISLKRSLKR